MSETIKIIDLLNKIANGVIPNTIKFNGDEYTYDDKLCEYYRSIIGSSWIGLTTDYSIIEILNHTVEIIEDEIIEDEDEIDIQRNKRNSSSNTY